MGSIGKDLATKVAAKLKSDSIGLCECHQGSCGSGITYGGPPEDSPGSGEGFKVGSVYEGYMSKVTQTWEDDADFVQWLAGQSSVAVGFGNLSKSALERWVNTGRWIEPAPAGQGTEGNAT